MIAKPSGQEKTAVSPEKDDAMSLEKEEEVSSVTAYSLDDKATKNPNAADGQVSNPKKNSDTIEVYNESKTDEDSKKGVARLKKKICFMRKIW